jgi:hypothetical protein
MVKRACTRWPGTLGAPFTGRSPGTGLPVSFPAPGFPPNYLGMLGPWTGHVSRVTLSGPRLEPQGLLFLSADR